MISGGSSGLVRNEGGVLGGSGGSASGGCQGSGWFILLVVSAACYVTLLASVVRSLSKLAPTDHRSHVGRFFGRSSALGPAHGTTSLQHSRQKLAGSALNNTGYSILIVLIPSTEASRQVEDSVVVLSTPEQRVPSGPLSFVSAFAFPLSLEPW